MEGIKFTLSPSEKCETEFSQSSYRRFKIPAPFLQCSEIPLLHIIAENNEGQIVSLSEKNAEITLKKRYRPL